jgi:hypothetical protein
MLPDEWSGRSAMSALVRRARTKYAIFPGLALSGLVLWQLPLIRSLMRRRD